MKVEEKTLKTLQATDVHFACKYRDTDDKMTETKHMLMSTMEAIREAISWGEAIQQAGGELPERTTAPDYDTEEEICDGEALVGMGFNKCLDEVTPLVAKKNARIEELESEVEKLEAMGREDDACLASLYPEKRKLIAENEELKERLGSMCRKCFEAISGVFRETVQGRGMEVTREEFLKNQKEYCEKKNAPHFMPHDGKCSNCRQDIVPKLIEMGLDGTGLVTGCPLCHRSYCD